MRRRRQRAGGRLRWLWPVAKGLGAPLVGALVVAAVAVMVRPLVMVRGWPEVRRAQARFADDLACYRARPLDLEHLETLKWATAAYEDRSYFSRPRWGPPLSPYGLARAVALNLRGRRAGGSTIPQQLAKLYLRGPGRPGLKDKGVEALLATWLVRQAGRDELLGLYLNLAAARFVRGRGKGCSAGADRLSLALFGLPLGRLGREDQLVLAGVPRGVGWLRRHPQTSLGRIRSAQRWMVAQGRWDARRPSYLDQLGPEHASTTFSFVAGWQEALASRAGASSDFDLTRSMKAFRKGLGREIRSSFPGARLRAAFAVVGPRGKVLARSGAEAAAMLINYGSVAKVEPLHAAVEALGPAAVQGLRLPPGPCVRWFWSAKGPRPSKPASWCPTDVAPPREPMGLDEAVARSVNSMTARHVALLPYRLWQSAPSTFAELSRQLGPREMEAFDSAADRAIAATLLGPLGVRRLPDEVPPELAYSGVQRAWFRWLRQRRQSGGLPSGRLPLDPTQSLGANSRATVEHVGRYLHGRLFDDSGECRLSDTGALLALRREDGTLRWLAAKHRDLVFAGKTGTSPQPFDSAVAGVALCLDGRPAVLAAAVRSLRGPLPRGLHGSRLLRGVHTYLKELERLERPVTSAALPAWAQSAVAAAELDGGEGAAAPQPTGGGLAGWQVGP